MEDLTGEREVSGVRRGGIDSATRPQRVAIALFEHFSLLDVSGIAEVFNLANRLHASSFGSSLFTVSLFSSRGGSICSTSGVRVSTDSPDARYASGFDALFVVGGAGA